MSTEDSERKSETSTTEQLPLPLPKCASILYQGIEMAQNKGVYSLRDASLLYHALESLRVRLNLDENFQVLS
jgi:hypothetical protein